MTSRTIIYGCAIATVDASDSVIDSGYIVLENDRIRAVGSGAPQDLNGRLINASGCLATPGLINTHHHLYQWLTRGHGQNSGLLEWVNELWPLWTRLDSDMVFAAARAALAMLALSGCTTTADHHYIFPSRSENMLHSTIEAARHIGVRLHAVRGCMDIGRSRGGLPPDELTEDLDTVLIAIEGAIDRFHDPSPNSKIQIGVGPLGPLAASQQLMTETAELARAKGVRLHTHIAEEREDEALVVARFGRSSVEYLDELGWLGNDTWLAHCVQLGKSEIGRLSRTRTSVAHCPSSNARLGDGIAPVSDLLAAGVTVGLGVDGAASQEAGQLAAEMKQALYLSRLRDGPSALRPATALRLATLGGASCLGRHGDLGSLEPGKLADIALWWLGDLGHAGMRDPVAALVLGPPATLELLLVGGEPIVSAGRLVTQTEDDIVRQVEQMALRLHG
ncbi:hydroxydechloroatrazine ethylaminohydrolase [Micromonospora sp. CB01531]|nr:hydroxydechloroatrazine ethylaminohydrolase [Micromonospora sp. CB01531]